jgi:hypothetical protein
LAFREEAMHKLHVLTADQYLAREAANVGLCFGCGHWSADTDPGAARVKCYTCGNHTLHGVEQALLLGALDIRR